MKILKKINTKKIILVFLKTLLLIAGFLICTVVYSLIFQQELISIDKYNFEQLKKVDQIITDDKEHNVQFLNIGGFNKGYNVDIKPIKNCYYMTSFNGEERYLFGFKLESIIYKLKYFSNYYAYPKYDLPIKNLCYGVGDGGCSKNDINFIEFKKVIFSSCE